jgi:hypothetical protein
MLYSPRFNTQRTAGRKF